MRLYFLVSLKQSFVGWLQILMQFWSGIFDKSGAIRLYLAFVGKLSVGSCYDSDHRSRVVKDYRQHKQIQLGFALQPYCFQALTLP